jgi:hypothetical protein
MNMKQKMKLIAPLLSAAVLCILSVSARATGAPHYALLISGLSRVELSDTTSVRIVAFNNTTILRNIIAQGDAPGVTRPSELDIVVTPADLEVDVINRTTHDIVEVLGQAGSLSYNGVTQTVARKIMTQITSANAFTFSLPDSSSSVTYNVNILMVTSSNVDTGQYSRIVMTFNGGNYPAAPATLIIGSLRFTGRVYYYGG